MIIVSNSSSSSNSNSSSSSSSSKSSSTQRVRLWPVGKAHFPKKQHKYVVKRYMFEQPMFQKSHQKQTLIRNTKIIKTIGTNNEENIQEYKPHVKNNPINNNNNNHHHQKAKTYKKNKKTTKKTSSNYSGSDSKTKTLET